MAKTTITGRRVIDPNLQRIETNNETSKKIKAAFTPTNTTETDYSEVEKQLLKREPNA
jgi:DNA polymerase I-like protein with 3'-5' exonuclease and polymerase domains